MRSPWRLRWFGLLALVASAFAAFVACSDEEAASSLEEPDSGPLPPIRAGAKTNTPDGSVVTASTMRIAHLAAESGPIDFCYQVASSGTFVGPVLGGPGLPPPTAVDASDDASDAEADADAALDAGAADADADAGTGELPNVPYGTVTKYLVLQAAGPITLAILPGGANSCANPIAKGDITLDPGKLSTVALFSRIADGGVALEVAGFTDDRTTESDKIRVRVIHGALGTRTEAPSGLLAVRANGSKTTVLADRVEPRRAASISEPVFVDGLGYVTAAPIPPPTTLSIGPAATDGGADAGFDPWISKPADLALTGGSLHTAFVLPGSSGARFSVLWCADTTTEGSRTTCRWVR